MRDLRTGRLLRTSSTLRWAKRCAASCCAGVIDAKAGERSLRAAEALVVERWAHQPLRPRAWQLRDTVSFHDALYVALAERADVPLLTADARLAGAHGPRASIETV